MRKLALLIAVVTAALAAQPAARAIEGKWTPEQVLQLDADFLQELGLEIPPASLWTPGSGGLLEAAVDYGGCSAGFISSAGLLATNHHCAFSLIQENSTPESDLITDGFLAAHRSEELHGEGKRVTVPHRFTDVTATVEAAVPEGADDLQRQRAIEDREKELVAACEAEPFRRCEVAAFDGGLQYVLVERLEFPDVRLVFAPPRSVGNFGGEVDNWTYPRHAGDFSLLRVYAGPDNQPAPYAPDNVPYRPAHVFPPAPAGVGPADFVMVVGYPGRTYRDLTLAEARERAELYFPARADLFADWLGIMEQQAATGDATRIALASRMRSLANGAKNARGQLAGIARGHILEHKAEQEEAVLAWVRTQPDLAAAVEAHQGLAAMVEAQRAAWQHDFLLGSADRGPLALSWGLTLVRWTAESAKPDLEREPGFMERNRARLRERLETGQKRYDENTDILLMVDLLQRMAALPDGQRIPAVDAFVEGVASPAELTDRVTAAYRASRLADPAVRLRLFDGAALEPEADPLLAFAAALDGELRRLEERQDRWKGTVSRLRPSWLRAVHAFVGAPVAPDANGTLRVSFAHVKGYSPRDAIWCEPETTVAGIIEKNTGIPPFDAPAALLAAAADAGGSRWADTRLGDVPVDFLADADTTGGNSGSPVLNGRGELVGLNFDRVWENVANDFGYNPAVARNVSVDIRYLFWVLSSLHPDRAADLLAEMGAAPAAAEEAGEAAP